MIDVEPLVFGALTLEPSPGGAVLDLVWKGRSTDRQPARVLVPYVAGCLDVAKARGLALRMRFEELEHMNSSTIAAILGMIKEARARGTRLILMYDPEKRWQQLGFDALRAFESEGAVELVEKELPR